MTVLSQDTTARCVLYVSRGARNLERGDHWWNWPGPSHPKREYLGLPAPYPLGARQGGGARQARGHRLRSNVAGRFRVLCTQPSERQCSAL